MKTSSRWVQSLVLAAGGLWIGLPTVMAAPGGGTVVGTAGTAAVAGHAATAPAPAARSAGPHGGGRPSVGAAGGFHAGPGVNVGASGYRGPGPAAGGIRTAPGFAANPGFSVDSTGQRLGTPQAMTNLNNLPVSRVRNAWTDPANPRVVGSRSIAGSGGYATPARRNDPVYSTRPGNHLYPGVYGYGQSQPSNNRSRDGTSGGNGYRGRRRYYYNNFSSGFYYPYLYSNFGYGGYGNYGYGTATADYSEVNSDNRVADLGAPDFSSTPNNYYSDVAPEPETPGAANPPASNQALPDAPAVGPQNPSASDRLTIPAQGPDSLVEAVQNELSHRGYFAGKPDSMYSAATKEAIRRFQTDQGLPATGRINEATLHALHLD